MPSVGAGRREPEARSRHAHKMGSAQGHQVGNSLVHQDPRHRPDCDLDRPKASRRLRSEHPCRSLVFGWKCRPSSWHPYTQRVWNVWVEVPSPGPSPGSCLNPDSTFKKARQWKTPSQRRSRPHRVFKSYPRSSFSVSSLGSTGIHLT